MPLQQLSLTDEIKQKKLAGFRCDCCGLYVKMYSRPLLASMCLVLIEIYKSGKREFIHVEDFLKERGKSHWRGDFHKLRFWNLLEKKIEDREDGSPRNGFYKLTGRGILFVEEKLKVKEKVLIFDNKFEGFDGEEIGIREALGKKFDYDELIIG